MKFSRGVTLIELLMAVLIGSLLSLAVTRIFSSGVRITQKGTSHLTNVQNAAILMMQLEKDLERAEKIVALDTKAPGATEARFEILTPEGKVSVTYQPTSDGNGYRRLQSPVAGAGPETAISHVYASSLAVQFSLATIKIKESTGVTCEIRVKAKPSGGEEAVLKRFIYCPNLPENRQLSTFGWRY